MNQPQLSDLLGVHIEYVQCRPYKCSPIVATGTITAYEQRKDGFYMFVQPDKEHLVPKWQPETAFIRYLKASATAA